MSDLLILRALLFAGELFAASALLLAAAWIASRFVKQASLRHFAWLTAFGALLVLPLLAAAAPTAIQIPVPASVSPPELSPTQSPGDMAMTGVVAPSSAGTFSLDMSTLALAIAALWFAGFCVMLLRGGIGALCLHRLRRRSRPHALAPADLPRIEAARRECELRLSQTQQGPMTWGIFRPVILLPRNSMFWPRERLQAVLLHELAHIRRRDSSAQLLAFFACAIYWPNPLVWIAARAMRREAEIAADDTVIALGVKPSSYAKELVQLASEFRAPQLALSGVPLSMAAPSALEARIKSVLAPNQPRSGVTAMDILKVLSLGLLTTTAIAIARPSLAEESPLPPTPPAVATSELAPPSAAAPAQETPPVPPSPPVGALAPVPPAPPAPPADANAGGDVHVLTIDGKHVHLGHKLTAREREQIRIAVRQAGREARAALKQARPEIERALREAKISEKTLRAIKNAEPEIRAAMDQAMRNAGPELDKALAKARPEVDRALAEAHAALANANIDVKVQAHIDRALKDAQRHIEASERHADEAGRDMERDAPDAADEPEATEIEQDSDNDLPDEAEDAEASEEE